MSEMSLDEIEQKLAYVGSAAPRIARSAMLAGAKVVCIAQRAACKSAITGGKDGKVRSTGAMERSINYRQVPARKELAAAKSGFDVGKQKKEADPDTGVTGHHGHLFVGGTVRRFTGSVRIRVAGKVIGRKPTGPVENRGIMPSHRPSFIKTAAESAQSSVASAVHASLVNGITRAIDKLGG
jgi:hypothetical protein